ncbi:ferredoxin [Cyanobacterium sp. IPPAS B-1200]|uniref:ferredoxin n=1 Tax=Cyanobacterium sp. IPPAS B-1200 TaxID=1562720 RepID=UPI0008524FAF|nr:ferredoxin [Cyanobacterium sp. IPPAS B-1200]OEJ77338.1 ferredoxin [Cyanobacterium sp. IPPAS B-1200]
MFDEQNISENNGFEPELGGIWRDNPERSGFEPELGGSVRQKGVYVDEVTCIGCKNCVHVAPNTFYIEDNFGRSRVYNQNGDEEDIVQEAMDTCPVDCIHWLDYTEVREKEAERKNQEVRPLGYPQVFYPKKNRKKMRKSLRFDK